MLSSGGNIVELLGQRRIVEISAKLLRPRHTNAGGVTFLERWGAFPSAKLLHLKRECCHPKATDLDLKEQHEK
jgi:hypothetical protein